MAEGIVISVLGKLAQVVANVVVKEVLLLHGIDQQVEKVSRELCRIQAFLEGADKKHITDPSQKLYVKEVRDLAYSIEDVIDTFLLDFPQNPQKSGKINTMKMMFQKTKKLPTVHKLVDDINLILTKMNEIKASIETLGTKKLGEGGVIILPVRPPVLPDINPDIVGFKEDLNRLVQKLHHGTIKKLVMVSIWGVGGLGKTTLALKIYNCIEVKHLFDVRIWVTISQKWEVIDVINTIAWQLKVTTMHSANNNIVGVLTEIRNYLSEKKYLIVLDDVWTTDLWTQIGVAFPDENNGSRVLITTRFFNIGEEAGLMCEQYKPASLTEKLSRELLLKTAFPNLDPNKDSFHDLSNILGQFIHKCDGLPLALVVLGGLLSKKPRTNTAWSDLFHTMSWLDEGKNCSKIIASSYEDLPFALKSCFMYFAAFPEDYDIDAPALVRMWIAEGFITQENKRTLQETAYSFLEDLVKRSLVQVNYRWNDGSIQVIRIHDVLLELAINKAKEQNFLMVYSHPSKQKIVTAARRVAIHNQDCDVQLSENLRTLLCFYNGHMPDCSKLRLLKVVSTGDYNTKVDPQMFEGLKNLKYLKLNWTPRGNM